MIWRRWIRGLFLCLFFYLFLFAHVAVLRAAEDPLQRKVKTYVAGRLFVPESDLQVTLARSPFLSVSDDDLIEIEEVDHWVGRVAFTVKVVKNGKVSLTRRVAAEVKVLQPIIVSSHPLRRYQIIKSEDLLTEMVYLGRQPTAMSVEPFIGKRMVRSIGKGVMFALDMVEAVPLILKGDFVTILFENHGLKVTARGRANEDGFLGRPVAVINVGSGKIVYGEVEDSKTVRMSR